MRKTLTLILATVIFWGAFVQADEATEKAIIKLLMDDNAYTRENLKGGPDNISEKGSLEFWSSGGLLNELPAGLEPQEFDAFSISLKHITVITLVPGQAAVAQYYSEGAMDPKTSAAVNNYRTRVTQVFVKEGGKWKVRAAHWSPIAGGAGTTQTSVDD